MSSEEVSKILKEAGISGGDEIAAGIFEPFEISKDVLDDMVRNNTIDQLPMNDINDMMFEYMDRQFYMDREPATEEFQELEFNIINPGISDQELEFNIIDPGTQSQLNIPTQPVQPQTPQERQRMVIGTASNPFTAIRDLEISPPPRS